MKENRFDFPPWYVTVPALGMLLGIVVLFSIIGARAWDILDHQRGFELAMKAMSITMIPFVLFGVGLVVAMARK